MIWCVLICSLLTSALARVALYGPCDAANDHLDANSKAFITDCDSFGYCATNGTCLPRQCRRDEFILGSLLKTNMTIPPLCPAGSFCPDSSSGCLPLVPAGGKCQLNRDDECQPPLEAPVVNDPWGQMQGNGAICLQGTCMYANASLGTACITESTTYTGYDVSGASFDNQVIRDNCIEGQGYCDQTQNTCVALKPLEASCAADRECQSYTCNTRSSCAVPPESGLHVARWVYVLTGLLLASLMAATLALLVRMHRRAQADRRIMLEEYYKEQTAYRHSILSFHSAFAGKGEPPSSETMSMLRSMSEMSDKTLVEHR